METCSQKRTLQKQALPKPQPRPACKNISIVCAQPTKGGIVTDKPASVTPSLIQTNDPRRPGCHKPRRRSLSLITANNLTIAADLAVRERCPTLSNIHNRRALDTCSLAIRGVRRIRHGNGIESRERNESRIATAV